MFKYRVAILYKYLFFIGVFTNVNAQEFIGLRTDNYAGSNGMLLNPAMPITGKLPWDINVFALGVYEDNNYISIFHEKLNEVKPSTKFYHQTIYVAPSNDASANKIEDILPEDGN